MEMEQLPRKAAQARLGDPWILKKQLGEMYARHAFSKVC
jgi:hypothetical protein